MHNQFKAYLEEANVPIVDEFWQEIQMDSKVMNINKHDVLVRSGSINKYYYFINSGSLATSVLTESGENKAVWFHVDSYCRIAICSDSYFFDRPTQYELRAIEPTSLIRLHKQKIDAWAKKYPAFGELYFRDITGFVTILQEVRAYQLSHTPLQFLSYIKEKFPLIIERLPSKYMAHFLGVSPEWYSKLKKKKA